MFAQIFFDIWQNRQNFYQKVFISGTYCEQNKFISGNLSISCRDQGANILFLETWSTTRKTNTSK